MDCELAAAEKSGTAPARAAPSERKGEEETNPPHFPPKGEPFGGALAGRCSVAATWEGSRGADKDPPTVLLAKRFGVLLPAVWQCNSDDIILEFLSTKLWRPTT